MKQYLRIDSSIVRDIVVGRACNSGRAGASGVSICTSVLLKLVNGAPGSSSVVDLDVAPHILHL
jgi:hypothetical protein